MIQVHGGGWLAGSRYEQGIPLLNHLASIGWVGFNIDYRLSPQATFPDHIVDVKRAIAWVRENAEELGIDPEMICITGGSAGGHLTALAGLTENDPAYQPGFEDADTSLAAAVPFYGVYDLTNSNGLYYPQMRDWVLEQIVFKRPFADAEQLYRDASPSFRVHADAPPFLVIHGDRDTLVPVGDARDFVERLRAVSPARSATSSCRRRARVRPLALRAHRADLRGDRPVPDRDRARAADSEQASSAVLTTRPGQDSWKPALRSIKPADGSLGMCTTPHIEAGIGGQDRSGSPR